jgi:putative hydrolase of the HAD superfamily
MTAPPRKPLALLEASRARSVVTPITACGPARLEDERERKRSSPADGARERAARGKRLSIVTNAHRDRCQKVERTGIDRFVDSWFSRTIFAAPRRGVLARARGLQPVDAGRTLLIEDSLSVIAAARAYGLRHTIAIRRPDSQLPPRAIAELLGVEGVFELV